MELEWREESINYYTTYPTFYLNPFIAPNCFSNATSYIYVYTYNTNTIIIIIIYHHHPLYADVLFTHLKERNTRWQPLKMLLLTKRHPIKFILIKQFSIFIVYLFQMYTHFHIYFSSTNFHCHEMNKQTLSINPTTSQPSIHYINCILMLLFSYKQRD